jgi:hypothetical protein
MKRHLVEDDQTSSIDNVNKSSKKIVQTSTTAQTETTETTPAGGPTPPVPNMRAGTLASAGGGNVVPPLLVTSTDAELDLWPSEVQIVIDSLLGFTTMGCLRCVLQHQLYHIISNRTLVDRDVGSLRESFRLRVFQSQAGAIIMRSKDYLADIRAAAAAAPQHSASLRAFEQWVLRFPHSSVLESELLSGTVGGGYPDQGQDQEQGQTSTCHGSSGSSSHQNPGALSQTDVSVLLQQGFLLPRRDADVRALWVHHPRLGMTAANIVAVRQQIVAMARRARFKEVSARQVAKAKAAPARTRPEHVGAFRRRVLHIRRAGSGAAARIPRTSRGALVAARAVGLSYRSSCFPSASYCWKSSF